jgi:hypothetical protein
MEILNKLKNGEYSLVKTYWLFGVVGNLPFNIFLRIDGLTLGTIFFVLVIAIAYNYFWILGCWKAASDYQGLALWSILAKIACALSGLSLLFGLVTLLSVI